MFDSHAHYTDARFDDDRDVLLGRFADDPAISGICLASSDIADSVKSLELAQRYEKLVCCCGVHPLEADKADEGYLLALEKLAGNSKVRAIGEIGLDYHYGEVPKQIQMKVFDEQLSLAGALGLPVVIHDREAHADSIERVMSHNARGVFHSYSGSRESAKILLRHDWYFSFTGVITFKNASSVRESAAYIPDDRILVETDCPYLAPVPYRGQRNDSALMRATLETLASVRNISFEEAQRLTTENAKRLFGIKQ